MAETQPGGRVITFNVSTAKRHVLSHTIVLALGFLIGVVGSRYSWQFFTPSYMLKADLAVPGSLHVKDAVQVAGVEVGRVWDIGLIPTGDKPVEVTMRIAKRFQPVIRVDSEASVATSGLLGGNYIDITRGSVTQPMLGGGATVKTADRTSAQTCDQIMKAFSRLGDALKSPFNH
jgi:phospholipid/cholesterol/gamma-HCH transport system substrate-binding protein